MDEDKEFLQRQLLAQGIRTAFARMKGKKLEKCARLQVSPYAVDKWMNGVSTPSEENLARLARHSGIEQEDIRNGRTDVFAD
jgi:transcriptional regulator with XRE-family HTH domain